jgi:hypothetical protein
MPPIDNAHNYPVTRSCNTVPETTPTNTGERIPGSHEGSYEMFRKQPEAGIRGTGATHQADKGTGKINMWWIQISMVRQIRKHKLMANYKLYLASMVPNYCVMRSGVNGPMRRSNYSCKEIWLTLADVMDIDEAEMRGGCGNREWSVSGPLAAACEAIFCDYNHMRWLMMEFVVGGGSFDGILA